MEVVAIATGIAGLVEAIAKASGRIKDALATGKAIYEEHERKRLEASLRDIKARMVALNGGKGSNIRSLLAYLDRDELFSLPWASIRQQFADIHAQLQDILGRTGPETTVLIDTTDFEKAGELRGALERQAVVYNNLAGLDEPTTPEVRSQLRKAVKGLKALRAEVIDLEARIGSYLDEFKP